METGVEDVSPAHHPRGQHCLIFRTFAEIAVEGACIIRET